MQDSCCTCTTTITTVVVSQQRKLSQTLRKNHSLLFQQHDSVLQLRFLWARSHLPLCLGFVRNKLLSSLLFLFLPTLLFLSYRLSPLSQQKRNRHYNIINIIVSWGFRQRRSAWSRWVSSSTSSVVLLFLFPTLFLLLLVKLVLGHHLMYPAELLLLRCNVRPSFHSFVFSAMQREGKSVWAWLIRWVQRSTRFILRADFCNLDVCRMCFRVLWNRLGLWQDSSRTSV